MKDLVVVALIAGGATTLGYVKDVWVLWRTEVVAIEDRKREIAREEAAAAALREAEEAKKKASAMEEIAAEMSPLSDFLIEQIVQLNDERNVLAVEKFIAEYQLHQDEEQRRKQVPHTKAKPVRPKVRPSWETIQEDRPQEEP